MVFGRSHSVSPALPGIRQAVFGRYQSVSPALPITSGGVRSLSQCLTGSTDYVGRCSVVISVSHRLYRLRRAVFGRCHVFNQRFTVLKEQLNKIDGGGEMHSIIWAEILMG